MDARDRIVQAATALLADGGRDAVTTRAVAAAAGVQAPTLYRLFGDKQGLLDAVAEHGFAAYVAEKAVRDAGEDPVQDLRRGFDLHVEFGLENPALYALMYAHAGDPSPAAVQAAAHLDALIARIAAAGRLRVGAAQAAALVHAAGSGVVFTLLGMPAAWRDRAIAEVAREAVLTAVTTADAAVGAPGPVGAAAALRAHVDAAEALSPRERDLLAEWLDRIVAG